MNKNTPLSEGTTFGWLLNPLIDSSRSSLEKPYPKKSNESALVPKKNKVSKLNGPLHFRHITNPDKSSSLKILRGTLTLPVKESPSATMCRVGQRADQVHQRGHAQFAPHRC